MEKVNRVIVRKMWKAHSPRIDCTKVEWLSRERAYSVRTQAYTPNSVCWSEDDYDFISVEDKWFARRSRFLLTLLCFKSYNLLITVMVKYL